jgi:hypothetical protein
MRKLVRDLVWNNPIASEWTDGDYVFDQKIRAAHDNSGDVHRRRSAEGSRHVPASRTLPTCRAFRWRGGRKDQTLCLDSGDGTAESYVPPCRSTTSISGGSLTGVPERMRESSLALVSAGLKVTGRNRRFPESGADASNERLKKMSNAVALQPHDHYLKFSDSGKPRRRK